MSKKSFANMVPRKPPGAMLLVAACAILLAQARADGEAPDAPVGGVSDVVTAPGPLPSLPVVARPAAQQPPVGLASDTHLDKTPPRKTVAPDLIRNGWTYNCMECHKLFPARWHYDTRPFNEHKNIQLEHGNNRFPTEKGAFS